MKKNDLIQLEKNLTLLMDEVEKNRKKLLEKHTILFNETYSETKMGGQEINHKKDRELTNSSIDYTIAWNDMAFMKRTRGIIRRYIKTAELEEDNNEYEHIYD